MTLTLSLFGREIFSVSLCSDAVLGGEEEEEVPYPAFSVVSQNERDVPWGFGVEEPEEKIR